MSNTLYYAPEVMVYFEKHHFFDIIKALLIRLVIDRPSCIAFYVKHNLRKIASKILSKNTSIHLPNEIDPKEFSQLLISISKTPVSIFNRAGVENCYQIQRNVLKFEKACQKKAIRNKIFLNYPQNFDEALQLMTCSLTLTNFINLRLDFEMTTAFERVVYFYRDITKEISPLTYDNYNDVAAEILYKIKYAPISRIHHFRINLVHRVVMIGRRGSGTDTQAKLLADRYKLTYINVETLIDQTLRSNSNMSRVLSLTMDEECETSTSALTALVWKRLLESDALHQGWVMVNFPRRFNELRILIEKCTTPPNGFVILHCPKKLALDRLIRQWKEKENHFDCNNTITKVDKEFAVFDENIKSMYCYLKTKNIKCVHVDAKKSTIAVRNKVFGLLERN